MIYTLGESLLDIIFTDMDHVVARPGGSMLNTAISLARMNHKVAHISELGDNEVAMMVIRFLNENQVDTSLITCYARSNTSLALAVLDDKKVPAYQFVKAYPERRFLAEVPAYHPSDLLLFGSMYAATAQIRMDLKRHVLAVKKAGGLLVYDPNIRQKHHLDNSDTVEAVMENLKWATVIKASDEDCAQIFGVNDQETYLDKLTEINPKALIFLTLGAKGAMCRLQNKTVSMEAIKTEVVSTIGAGDAFNAGLIAELIKQKITTKDITTLSEKNLLKLLRSGIKTATAVCATYDNYISRSL
ncbi:MAG: hypothetical protein K9G61_11010 [Bacteroidales bacterium]|nr:hypothetical protein [Bacteroidales bacterium]